MELPGLGTQGLPVPIQVPQGGPCAEQETQRSFFILDFDPHSCLLRDLTWAALAPLYSEGEAHPKSPAGSPAPCTPEAPDECSQDWEEAILRILGLVRENSQESAQTQALSPPREKENDKSPSQLPQAPGKQFARWNSTSNANEIIMTIFMGECGGLGVGFHYHVYQCDHLPAASLPLQAQLLAAAW